MAAKILYKQVALYLLEIEIKLRQRNFTLQNHSKSIRSVPKLHSPLRKCAIEKLTRTKIRINMSERNYCND